VVGDFDADGATSSALMVSALRAMGADKVDYLVPNRFEYGYGLTPEIVEVAAGKSPDLIVTVDNGISSLAGVEAARRRGIRVLAAALQLLAFLLMGSALYRMRLYQEAYGLTQLRFYTTSFMVWLALVFLLFAGTVLRERPDRFIAGVVGSALAAVLGGVDGLVFTAGIGEHSRSLRARVCADAAWLGVELDRAANDAGGPRITTAASRVAAWVVATNEELMIARHTRRVLAAS